MQFALLISVIIAILLSTFLLLTHVQSFFSIKSQELIEASELVNKQIFKSFADTGITKDTIQTNIGNNVTKLVSNYHGVWTKTVSKVQIRNKKVVKIAFTGSVIDQKTPNLYLADKNSPLVVVGNTRIEGNSYLPEQGIKAGNISGNYYHGTRLFYGRTIKSKKRIPELHPEWIEYLESMCAGAHLTEKNIIPLSKEIKNSFHNSTNIIYNTEKIVLGDEIISGNIIVQSASKIIINSTSQLTDVILIAPIIEVQNDVKGTIQLIATKKIKIGKRCHLSYPSSIILFDNNSSQSSLHTNTTQNQIPDFNINSNTIIEGAVVYLKKTKEIQNRIKTNIKVENNVQIIGEFYCQGNTDFQGTVKGALYVNQFIANQSGSIYLNHLYNGKVLKNPVSDYAGLSFENSKKNVAKWMY